ncbi:MAG: hypothetical protein GY744_19850 [Gammaproteobacteria bacterium]|nr:hypothetical protein [Gammaproteobacteria bacterium]
MKTNNIIKHLKLVSVVGLIISVSVTGNALAEDTSNSQIEKQQLQILQEWNKKAQARFNRKMEQKLSNEIQALANMPPKKSFYASRQSFNTDTDAKLVKAVNNRSGINTQISTPVKTISNNNEHCLINL